MPRLPVRDHDQVVQGYLDEQPDGRQAALTLNWRCIGLYDPVRDVTTDPNHCVIAHGNVLVGLLLGDFGPW